MTPANVNFAIYQGADWDDCIQLKNEDGTPLVFAYTHGRMQLREDYGQPIILDLTDGNGGIVFDSANGKINFHVDADESEALELFGEPMLCIYDLICYDSSGSPQVDRVAQGWIAIYPEVSRAPVP